MQLQFKYVVAGMVLGALLIATGRWLGWERESVGPPASTDGEPVLQSPASGPADTTAVVAEPPLPAETSAPEVPPPTAPPPPSLPPLPPLEASDAYVREHFATLPAPWLERDDLIARATTVLVNVAAGTVPRRQIAFLAPAGPFPVVRVDEETWAVDPQGYRRYDALVGHLTAVPAERLAAFVHRVMPLLQSALSQLGETRPLPVIVREALSEIRAVPLLETPPLLHRPGVMYEFVDPALEGRPELHRQLLRMGPENVRVLQAYARSFEAAFDAASAQ